MRTVMAGWLHGFRKSACCFICGFSLSLFCNYHANCFMPCFHAFTFLLSSVCLTACLTSVQFLSI